MEFLFGINFYSGDIFQEGSNFSVLEILLSGLGGVVVGFLLTLANDAYKEQRQINKAGKNLINEIILLQDPVEKQNAWLNSLVSQLRNRDTLDSTFRINSRLNLDYLVKIDRSYATDYFKSKLKDDKKGIEKINKIFSSIDIINFNLRRIQEIQKAVVEQRDELVKRYNYFINRITRYCSKLRNNIEAGGGNIDNDLFVVNYFSLIREHVWERQDNDLIRLRNFHGLLGRFNAFYRLDTRAEFISDNNYECNQVFNRFDNIKEETAIQVEQLARSFREQMRLLLIEIKDFESSIVVPAQEATEVAEVNIEPPPTAQH